MHTISAGTRSSSIKLTSSWTGSAVAAMAAGTGTALLSEDSDSSIVMWNQYAHQSYEARQVGEENLYGVVPVACRRGSQISPLSPKTAPVGPKSSAESWRTRRRAW